MPARSLIHFHFPSISFAFERRKLPLKREASVRIIFLLHFLVGFIPSDAQPLKLMPPIGHDGWVEIVKFTPDNKFIISSADKELMIWDASSKLLLLRHTDHTRQINTIEFSTDGRYFVTGANDSTAKIWDVKTASLLHSVRDSGKIKNASFSSDGKLLITHTNKSIKTWDAYTGKLLLNITERSWENPASAVFSPDGKYILKGGSYKSTIFESSTGKLVRILDDRDNPHRYENIFAGYSHNGKWILSAGDRTPPKLWSSETGEIVREFKGHEDVITITAFSPDDKLLVTVSQFNESPKIWNVSTGNMTAQLVGHTNSIQTAKFSPDGYKIVTSSWDRTAKVWDAHTGKLLLDLAKHSGNLYYASFSLDGKMIVTGSADQTVKLWDAESGELIGDMKGHTTPLGKSFERMTNDTMYSVVGNKLVAWNTYNGTLSGSIQARGTWISNITSTNDGKFLVTGTDRGSVELWDAKTFSRVSALANIKEHIYDLSFSGDGRFLAVASKDSMARVIDLKSGQVKAFYKIKYVVTRVILSKTGDILIGMSRDEKLARVWNTENNMLLYELRHGEDMQDIALSPDGKYIVSCAANAFLPKGLEIKAWDAGTGKLINEFKKPDNWGFEAIYFSPDSKVIIAEVIDGRVLLWDYKQKSKWKFLNAKDENEWVRQVSLLPGHPFVMTASAVNHTVKIRKLKNGKIISTLRGHTDYVNAALLTPDGKHVITASGDNSSRKWNARNGDLIGTFLVIDSNDYFTQIPSGYYQCSSQAAKLLHYVTTDLKVITFEQLDVKYNRPDKVLEAFGNADSGLIRSYRQAYEKRLKKLGVDTTAFREGYSVPEADFSNRETIVYAQKSPTLALHIQGKDSNYKLDRFNVWVNEIPVFGMRGKNLREKDSNSIDTVITIHLSQDENRIETSITNVNGTESYRKPLTVGYKPKDRQKEVTYFIGIGIDKFADSRYNLQYSSKDIRDLADSLEKKYHGNIIIDTLFNEQVTIKNIKALKQKLLTSTENDKVIIAYSGHGMLSNDFDYYLSTYSVNFDKPEENGLPYEELEDLLDSIPARKKLMLIDACHSGEVDKEDLTRLNTGNDSLVKGFKPVAYKKEGQLGLKNSFELMQSLFVNVGKSTGATIISAAAGTQFALERNDLKNGVFTYSILEAMNKFPSMKISELKKVVSQRVIELTKGMQQPTSRNEAIAVDWNLW